MARPASAFTRQPPEASMAPAQRPESQRLRPDRAFAGGQDTHGVPVAKKARSARSPHPSYNVPGGASHSLWKRRPVR